MGKLSEIRFSRRQFEDDLMAQCAKFKAECQVWKLRACELAEAHLTLITLCDMVLGEDAPDRSDTALIRAVGELLRER